MHVLRLSLLVIAILVGSLGSCLCGGAGGPCASDADCDPAGQGFNACELESGLCVCKDDRGCGGGEFCNAVGRCQTIAGCFSNDDCGGEGLFCDITTSQCLSLQECNPRDGQTCCSVDSQCPFRQICDGLTLSCIPGCRDDADCVLGEGCTGAGFGRVGQCGEACTSDNQCPSQHLCNSSSQLCELDTRGNYCLGCSGGVESDDCGDPGNYCLVDTINQGEFCGVDCYAGEACPSGYSCQDVIIVLTTYECTFPERCVEQRCERSNTTCQQDADCQYGFPFGDCRERVGRSGSCEVSPLVDCARDADCADAGGGRCVLVECRGGEADTTGFCSCTRNEDCFSDDCLDGDPQNGVRGHCRLSGHECFEDLDCDVITCVDGGCLIGKNCAPSSDRSCRDLLPPSSPQP